MKFNHERGVYLQEAYEELNYNNWPLIVCQYIDYMLGHTVSAGKSYLLFTYNVWSV